MIFIGRIPKTASKTPARGPDEGPTDGNGMGTKKEKRGDAVGGFQSKETAFPAMRTGACTGRPRLMLRGVLMGRTCLDAGSLEPEDGPCGIAVTL